MLKKFTSKIREFKIYTLLAPLFMSMEVVAEVSIPFTMTKLIDKGVELGDMNAILHYGLILVALASLGMIFGTLSGVCAATAACGFAKNLRNDMFCQIQKFSFSNIDKFSSSSLITRLTTDVINVQNAFQAIIRQAVRSTIMIVAALIMVFTISPKLAWIYLIVMPFLAISLFLIIFKVHPIFERGLKLYDKLNNVVQENLHGIRVVKAYVRKEDEKEKFNNISSAIYNDFATAQKKVALNPALIQLCVYSCILLISWLGSKLVVSKIMTTGQMMSFFTYTMQLLMNLMLISIVFVMIIIARSSAKRVVEVLSEESALTNPANPIYQVKDGSIAFNNVGFSYVNDPNKLCLFDVNLSINSGETIGIIGSTGSSKTSLTQLIPRLYDVTCGSLTVGGEDVKNYDLTTLRNSVAMVLQKNTLFSGTIKDNLRWGNENATDEDMINACKLAQAHEFICQLKDGYNTYIEQGGTNVSGGQRQRLCIARALLKNPKILILDDSTSAVDTKTDSLLKSAFKSSLPNTTKIIIAQRISSIMEADRIIVMDGGRINAVGTHKQLIKSNSIYKEVFSTQIQGGGDFDE